MAIEATEAAAISTVVKGAVPGAGSGEGVDSGSTGSLNSI